MCHWTCHLWICCLILALKIITFITSEETHEGMDILHPYLSHHGPKHRIHRDTQSCQSVKYGNVTHSMHQSYSNHSIIVPLFDSFHMMKEVNSESYWDKKNLMVLHQIVNDPASSLSVIEPGFLGSCLNASGTRATVRETAQQNECVFASNAGFFNTHNGLCLGNIVSNGKFVHNSRGIQNAHFGITKDGRLFTGYLSELDYLALGFEQLVGGVIWLVRDGESYVEESIKLECSDTEETGTLERFGNVVSARTAIGHDKEGKVHIVQVNGWTDHEGVNLHQFADLLISLGISNAINLDGGGSATSIINDTLVNFPSDKCPDGVNNCERAVSTILCVHYPACPSPACSDHGTCDKGQCHCHEPWQGQTCDTLDKQRCGPRGTWDKGACICEAGWYGLNCSLPCQPGWYGSNCSHHCSCGNHGDCSPLSGECLCHPGYIGQFCHQECPYGFYGNRCLDVCFCHDSCFCDHVTGSCNITNISQDYMEAGDCLIQEAIQRDHLVPDRHDQYSLCISSVACLSIIATASLIVNAVLSYLLFIRRHRNSDQTEDTEASQSHKSKRLKRRKKRLNDQRNAGSFMLNNLKKFRRVGNNVLKKEEREPFLEEGEVSLIGSEEENDLFIARKKLNH